MSVVLEKDNFTITDSLGNTKFSLDRRIPHIIYNLPGVVPIPTILGANPNASAVERTDEIVLINNSLINTNDYFISNLQPTNHSWSIFYSTQFQLYTFMIYLNFNCIF